MGKDTSTKLPFFGRFLFVEQLLGHQNKVLKTGFLFAAAEFGNHALYQFQGIGTDEEDPMCTSSHPHGAQVREDLLVVGGRGGDRNSYNLGVRETSRCPR